MELRSDDNLMTPTVSPALAPRFLAPPAPSVTTNEEAPASPEAPAPDAAAPAAAGGDPDDSGDGDGDDDDDIDDNNSDNDNDNNDDDNNSNGGNQGGGPPQEEPKYYVHTSTEEPSHFRTLLLDVLDELGNMVKPLFVTQLIIKLDLDVYYNTNVHIRGHVETTRGVQTIAIHDSTIPHETYAAFISNASRRALWSLCYSHHLQLFGTNYHHLPRRFSGTEHTHVLLGEPGEDRLNVLAGVTTSLNTDIKGATTELEKTHEKLQDALKKIAQL